VGVWRRSRRRRGYREYCSRLGFTFFDDRSTIGSAVWMSIPLFNQGWGQRWRFAISGNYDGHGFWVGEWSFFTGFLKSSTRHVFGVILWTPGETLPRFTCIPNAEYTGSGGWLSSPVPGDDPELTKEAVIPGGVMNGYCGYRLRAARDEDVTALLTPGRRSFLETHGGQHLATGHGALVWWEVGELPLPAALDDFIREGHAARAAFANRGTRAA